MGNNFCKNIKADTEVIEKDITPVIETISKDLLIALTPVLQAMEQRIIQQVVANATVVEQKV